MPNACLEMLTTFPVVRCCAHFFLHVGWHVFALTRTNACTDFVGLFPSLSNGCIVTVHIRRALHWLHCFPALFVAYNFLSVVQANFPAFCTLCTECILHCTSLLSLSWSRPNSLSHRKSEFVKENEKWRGTYWRLFKITPQQHHEGDKTQQSLNWTQTFLIAEKWLTLQEFQVHRLLFNSSNAEDVSSVWSLPTETSDISSFRFIRFSWYSMNTSPIWLSTLEIDRRGSALFRYRNRPGIEHCSYVWTEFLSGMVFVPARELSGIECEQSLCWKPF